MVKITFMATFEGGGMRGIQKQYQKLIYSTELRLKTLNKLFLCGNFGFSIYPKTLEIIPWHKT
jgi:hypothetical protein